MRIIPTTLQSQFMLSLLSVLVAAAALSSPAQAAQPEIRKLLDQGELVGLWVWPTSAMNTDEAQDQLIGFAQQEGFNVLLVQLHWEQGSIEAGQPVLGVQDQYRRLIKKAADAGIAVEALDGGPDWAMAEHHDLVIARLRSVLDFNASLPEGQRFTGLHWDIEPYVMDVWKQDEQKRQQIMHEYLQLYAAMGAILRLEAPELTLAADIPMWYDSAEGKYDIAFLGQTKPLNQHIQDLTDYIGIMSYRTHGLGRNSATAHAQNEIDYAAKIGRWACPALETTKVDEAPQISFYGRTEPEYRKTKQEVQEYFSDHPGCGGILIHHYNSLTKLLGE